ncbi:hypothetical protein BT93_B2075 [Corymbia citriodora subsp. variegata]|nr:hypothetical protein BT93_B2075 [Corymbia citriodora subsp. variegata]
MALEFEPASAKPAAPAKPATTGSRAYVTFVAGKGDSVKGVVGLANGLRKVQSAHRLVVAVLPDVPAEHRQVLKEQGCRVREIKPVCPPGSQTPFAASDYFINYSKLGIWEFVEYSKMVYLHGDMQVYDNIDHLFDMEDGYFYAVLDCFCERTWSHTPSTRLVTANNAPTRSSGDFLNTYFRNIYKPLPPAYNLGISMLWRHPAKVELDKVKVVHYCEAGSKPWMCTWQEDANSMQREDLKMRVKKLWDFAVKEDIKMLVQKWWDVYQDESLDYKNWIWRPRKRPSRSTGSLSSGPNKRSAK